MTEENQQQPLPRRRRKALPMEPIKLEIRDRSDVEAKAGEPLPPVESQPVAEESDQPAAGALDPKTQTPAATEAATTAEAAPAADEINVEPAEPRDGPVEATAVTAAEDDGELSDDEAADTDAIDTGVLEALLFSTHHPLTGAQIGELMRIKSQAAIRRAIQTLNQGYDQSGRSFRVEQVAGGYQMLTLPRYGDEVRRLLIREADAKLTKAALETLAIIAYKQPILRADLEAIRGVASGETIRSLMEKHLVRIAGRAEEPGRPILYGTTKRFLELFGLNSLKDLPQAEGLKKPDTAA